VVARLLLLSRTSDAGDTGMYTMELLELIGPVSYGLKMIKLGEKKGYIKRVTNIKPDREGNYLVVNYISLQRASGLSRR